MSNLWVALGPSRSVSAISAAAVLPHARPRKSGKVASGASSVVAQIGNEDIEAEAGDVWFLTAIGADLVVSFGATPDAASDAGHYLPAGISLAFPATGAGEKLSVIDASAL